MLSEMFMLIKFISETVKHSIIEAQNFQTWGSLYKHFCPHKFSSLTTAEGNISH